MENLRLFRYYDEIMEIQRKIDYDINSGASNICCTVYIFGTGPVDNSHSNGRSSRLSDSTCNPVYIFLFI